MIQAKDSAYKGHDGVFYGNGDFKLVYENGKKVKTVTYIFDGAPANGGELTFSEPEETTEAPMLTLAAPITEEPAEETNEEPAEETTVEAPVIEQEPTEETNEEPAEETVEETNEEPAEETTEEPAEETNEEPAEEPAE